MGSVAGAGTIAGMKIDYAILADHAEIVSARLYLMGGGRDVFPVPRLPGVARLAVAVGIRVEWEETNSRHPVLVALEDEDGKELVKIRASINVGRPAGLAPGSSQLAQFASAIMFNVAEEGGFRARIVAGEEEAAIEHRVPFRVTQAPQSQQAKPNPNP